MEISFLMDCSDKNYISTWKVKAEELQGEFEKFDIVKFSGNLTVEPSTYLCKI